MAVCKKLNAEEDEEMLREITTVWREAQAINKQLEGGTEAWKLLIMQRNAQNLRREKNNIEIPKMLRLTTELIKQKDKLNMSVTIKNHTGWRGGLKKAE